MEDNYLKAFVCALFVVIAMTAMFLTDSGWWAFLSILIIPIFKARTNEYEDEDEDDV